MLVHVYICTTKYVIVKQTTPMWLKWLNLPNRLSTVNWISCRTITRSAVLTNSQAKSVIAGGCTHRNRFGRGRIPEDLRRVEEVEEVEEGRRKPSSPLRRDARRYDAKLLRRCLHHRHRTQKVTPDCTPTAPERIGHSDPREHQRAPASTSEDQRARAGLGL